MENYSEIDEEFENESSFKKFRRKLRRILEKYSFTGFFVKAYDTFRVYGLSPFVRKCKDFYALHFLLKRKIKNEVLPSPEKLAREREKIWKAPKTISVVVPLYNTPNNYLEELISSVVAQTYPYWELCLADGSDDEHQYVGNLCAKLMAQEPRIKYEKLVKNEGISGNTNIALDMAKGEYISLLDHDDLLHPSVLFEVALAIETGADMIYTDEMTFENKLTNPVTIHLKPNFAIDNLRANNYICHFTTFSRELLQEAGGGFRSEYDGSQDFDMMLRLSEHARKITHIPKILYFWRSHAGSVASDISAKPYCITSAKSAINDHLQRQGIRAEAEDSPPLVSLYRIKYKLKERPLVSIIIPNKDQKEILEKCIYSILQKTTYSDYEIIIMENGSQEKEIFSYYNELKNKHKNIKIIKWEKLFNYAEINNDAIRYTKGKYLVFLNNDIEVITPTWLEELLMYAQRPDVGAVGAKLYYPDDTIQHAGIILDEQGIPKHAFIKRGKGDVGYMGRLYYAQDYSAVTAACLMVEKEKFLSVNGFSEEFVVSYNDVDFCLKLIKQGFVNVWTPFSELYHYESVSRGIDIKDKGKAQRLQRELTLFQTKWEDYIKQGDPYYNPNLISNTNFELRK